MLGSHHSSRGAAGRGRKRLRTASRRRLPATSRFGGRYRWPVGGGGGRRLAVGGRTLRNLFVARQRIGSEQLDLRESIVEDERRRQASEPHAGDEHGHVRRPRHDHPERGRAASSRLVLIVVGGASPRAPAEHSRGCRARLPPRLRGCGWPDDPDRREWFRAARRRPDRWTSTQAARRWRHLRAADERKMESGMESRRASGTAVWNGDVGTRPARRRTDRVWGRRHLPKTTKQASGLWLIAGGWCGRKRFEVDQAPVQLVQLHSDGGVIDERLRRRRLCARDYF